MLGMLGKIKDFFSSDNMKKALPYLFALLVLLLLRNVLKGIWVKIVNSFKSSGSVLTTESADSKAELLKTAFTNFIPHSSFEAVKQIFKNLELADYYKVKSAFGIQPRNPLTGGVSTGWQTIYSMDLDLTQWITKEVSYEQLSLLKDSNSLFAKIL